MKILFAFENPLPSTEADAEVFVTTGKYLVPATTRSWLHVPIAGGADRDALTALAGMPVIAARTIMGPGALRHFCCGLTLPFRAEFKEADLVYTRNLWVAWMAILFGQRVVFDHYRPWPDQIPPLQFWIYRLFCHKRFLVNICHSDYTREKYLALGIPADKLRRVHNGFEPERLRSPIAPDEAKRKIGVPAGRKTVVYTGRINHKKGLDLVVAAAKRAPEVLFILVGSYGDGPIEKMARGAENIRIVPYQSADALADYVFAADIVLIPPSVKPLAKFGSTVLPLKLFFYMASGRPILAGNTPDVREVLRHGENALLCQPDDPDALATAVRALLADPARAAALAETALADSANYSWSARARKIEDIVDERLRSVPAERGVWSRVQFRAWRHQSRRWLVHLVREGSWVLPPSVEPELNG